MPKDLSRALTWPPMIHDAITGPESRRSMERPLGTFSTSRRDQPARLKACGVGGTGGLLRSGPKKVITVRAQTKFAL